MKTKIWTLAIALVLAMSCPTAFAGGGAEFGVRAGYGVNPDQFVVGGQTVFGQPFKTARYAVSLDLGFGDNISTYLFNADLRILDVAFPGSASRFYFGGGPAIAVYDVDQGDSDTEIGLNLVTGLNLPLGKGNAYNLEARFGLGDMPDFRILFGIALGGRK